MAIKLSAINSIDFGKWRDEIETSITDNTSGYWFKYPYNDWTPVQGEPLINEIPSTSGYLSWDEKIKDTEVFEMYVYDVFVIDTKECEVLHRQEIIAEDEKAAMLGLDVDDKIRKLHKKGQVKFILNQLGGFNRYTRKVRIKEEDE